MTNQNLQQHRDRLETIRKGFWRLYESDQEHQDRADIAELRAGWYFDQATKGQVAAYVQSMRDTVGLWAPKDKRARDAAVARWNASTADARKLFEETFESLMATGELTEELGLAWDALCNRPEMATEAA